MAYGSPERQEDVEAYYTHIRGGRKPSAGEVENLKERYKAIGGHSPLLKITTSTAKKLEQRLAAKGTSWRVYAGMKHWHPYIAETFSELAAERTTELLAIALAPHYSKMSIGSYQEAVQKANAEQGNKVKLAFVDSWHLNSAFLEKWQHRVKDSLQRQFAQIPRDKVFFLFTAHSLPERILTWKDPYQEELLETARTLARMLNLFPEQSGFAFQSAGHTAEPWLGPDILDKLRGLKKEGWKNILVIPVGFVSDHLEILFDLDVEAKQLAKELELHLERTESFNDSEDFIDILYSVVKEQLE